MSACVPVAGLASVSRPVACLAVICLGVCLSPSPTHSASSSLLPPVSCHLCSLSSFSRGLWLTRLSKEGPEEGEEWSRRRVMFHVSVFTRHKGSH